MFLLTVAPDAYSIIYSHLNQVDLYRLTLVCRFFWENSRLRKILHEIKEFIFRRARAFSVSSSALWREWGENRLIFYIHPEEIKKFENYERINDNDEVRNIDREQVPLWIKNKNCIIVEKELKNCLPHIKKYLLENLQKLGIRDFDTVVFGTYYGGGSRPDISNTGYLDEDFTDVSPGPLLRRALNFYFPPDYKSKYAFHIPPDFFKPYFLKNLGQLTRFQTSGNKYLEIFYPSIGAFIRYINFDN